MLRSACMTAPTARASAFAGSHVQLVAAAPRPGTGGNACRQVTVCAKKGKDVRPTITLECTEQKATGIAGISRYTTEKARYAKDMLGCATAPCDNNFKYCIYSSPHPCRLWNGTVHLKDRPPLLCSAAVKKARLLIETASVLR